MLSSIPYADTHQAAASRSAALRWFLKEKVISKEGISRQFHLSPESVMEIEEGTPVLMTDDLAMRVDRIVAAQSVLLEGYSPGAMAAWFLTAMPALDGKRPSDLLTSDIDATEKVLKVAAAWMA